MVGELLLAASEARALASLMTTLRHINANTVTAHHATQPSRDPVKWSKAAPPKIRGKNGKLAMKSLDEWRPGETAKRGYEKAVEDWWWL